MCKRFVVVKSIREIEKRYQAFADDELSYKPSANIAKSDAALVITNKDPQQLQMFQFGLTLANSKRQTYVTNIPMEGKLNREYNTANYTGPKGILTMPQFKGPIRSQRCLIVCDAFIAGPRNAELDKPYLIFPRSKQQKFSLAGIWDTWIDPYTGKGINSFAIITAPANKLMKRIGHHRCPVVLLNGEDEYVWLKTNEPLANATALMKPFDYQVFDAYRISNEIKNRNHKYLKLLAPISGKRVMQTKDNNYDPKIRRMSDAKARRWKERYG